MGYAVRCFAAYVNFKLGIPMQISQTNENRTLPSLYITEYVAFGIQKN